MAVGNGYRFIQGLIPTRMHEELTEVSRKLGQSKAETLRGAISDFLKKSKVRSGTVSK